MVGCDRQGFSCQHPSDGRECLPDGGGSEAVAYLQQVVGVPHVLCLLWHQSHLPEEAKPNNESAFQSVSANVSQGDQEESHNKMLSFNTQLRFVHHM